MKKQLVIVFNHSYLRNILVAFLVIALLLPLYEQFRAFPPFRDLLTRAAEDQANRIATHLSSYSFFKKGSLETPADIPQAWIDEVFMVAKDLNLEKIKIFTKTGEVIFSTSSRDIGKRNKHDYFQTKVAAGQIYTKVVEKNSKNLEGEIAKNTVVETYIPIMVDQTFKGSFEIYYDISSQRTAMNNLLARFNIDMILMGIGLTLLASILISKASKEIHARDVAEEALRLSEQKFRGISDSAKDAIIMIDTQGHITLWNVSAEHMFGYSEAEIMGCDMHRILAPERFWHNANKGFKDFTKSGKGSMVVGRIVEIVALHKNGTEFPVEISASAIYFRGGWHAIGILRDISARKEAEQRLKLGVRVMENAADAILVTNNKGIIELVNPAFSKITGYPAEEVIGKNPNLLSSGRHGSDFYQEMWQTVVKEGVWRGEIWNRRKNGEIYPQRLSMSAIQDGTGETSHYVAVFNDISQRKADEEMLERLAFYDPLTGLPNRLLFRERLDRAMCEDNRHKTATALLFLDLDRFKQVNDVHGHEVGDLLLQEAAKRLKTLVREEDTVSRLGGDEFTVILRRASNPQDAGRVAGQIVEMMTLPFPIQEIECHIGVSIGVAYHPFHARDMETLIKRADLAMYVAKKGGRNRYHIFEDTANGTDEGA